MAILFDGKLSIKAPDQNLINVIFYSESTIHRVLVGPKNGTSTIKRINGCSTAIAGSSVLKRRIKDYSLHTRQPCMVWIKRFICHFGKRHPASKSKGAIASIKDSISGSAAANHGIGVRPRFPEFLPSRQHRLSTFYLKTRRRVHIQTGFSGRQSTRTGSSLITPQSRAT